MFVIFCDYWFSVVKYSSFFVSVFDYYYSRRVENMINVYVIL